MNLRTIFSRPALPSYENRLSTAGAKGGLNLIGFSSLVNTPKGRQLTTALASYLSPPSTVTTTVGQYYTPTTTFPNLTTSITPSSLAIFLNKFPYPPLTSVSTPSVYGTFAIGRDPNSFIRPPSSTHTSSSRFRRRRQRTGLIVVL